MSGSDVFFAGFLIFIFASEPLCVFGVLLMIVGALK